MATIPNKTAVRVLAPAFDNIENRLRSLENKALAVKRVGTDGIAGIAAGIGFSFTTINQGPTASTPLELVLVAGSTADETWFIDGKAEVQANSANWTRITARYLVLDGAGATVTTSGTAGGVQSHGSQDQGGWTDLCYSVYSLLVPKGQTRKVRLQAVGASFGGNYWSGDSYSHIRGIRAS